MDRPAYFSGQGGRLVPDPHARSPWSATMLHGRLLAGLAARAVEQEADAGGGDEFRLARLTVDLFRAAPMAPISTATTVVRRGRRVRAVDVSILCGEEGGEGGGEGRGEGGASEVARASAILLRVGEHPVERPWVAPEWDVPPPEGLEGPGDVGSLGSWDLRPITPGGFRSSERKQLWTRDTGQLVAGEPLTPVVRAALAADLPNPLANSSTRGLGFINADLTMTLARLPRSEWIGLDVTAHLGDGGIAIGQCAMYDREGQIGWSSVCALATEVMA